MKARLFALTLCFLLTVSLLGCEKIDLSGGKNPDKNQNTSAPSGDDSVFSVKTTVSGSETFRPEGGTPETDRILAFITEAEEKFGITVEAEIVSKETLSSSFTRAMNAGNKYGDLIQTDAGFLTQSFRSDNLHTLSDLGLTPSASGVLKQSDGTAYAFRADGWNQPLPTLSYLLYYNEKILTDSGCETPLELYEAGAWNQTTFLNLCKQVTAANRGEIWAIAHLTEYETDLMWATLHASGLKYFTDDGTCVMDSPSGLKGFSTLRTLLTSGVTYRLTSEVSAEADPTAKLAFTNRRTAFFVGNSAHLFDTKEDSLPAVLGEDLRIIGFPTHTSDQPGAAFGEQDIFFAVPKGANTELCKTLLPALFSQGGEEAKEQVITDYFYHESDGDLYFNLLSAADTETSLVMGDKKDLVEDFFLQVANGGSAKEILNNLQTIFNAEKKG